MDGVPDASPRPRPRRWEAPNNRRVGRALRSHFAAASITSSAADAVLARPEACLQASFAAHRHSSPGPLRPRMRPRMRPQTVHCAGLLHPRCRARASPFVPPAALLFSNNPPHSNNARMTPSPAHTGLALALVTAGRPCRSS